METKVRSLPIGELRDAIVADYQARAVSGTLISLVRKVLRIACA